jgi:hypothetical protein
VSADDVRTAGRRAAPGDESALLADRPTAELGMLRTRGAILAVAGLGASAAGFFMLGRDAFLQSYLIAYIFWIGITVGSLALLMVQYLSGGAWGLVGRRVFEASTRNLPLMAVLFLPIAFNLPVLYEWARPEAAANHHIHDKAAYLNVPFFYGRAVAYFAIWMGLAFFLNRWSRQQDLAAPRLPGPMDGRLRVLSGPGLVLYMITLTFMSVDWIMSLEPTFTSTIFGILMLGGQGLSTLAFTIVMLALLSRARPLSAVAEPDHFHDFGKLMLAFTMLWAYFQVSQLIIIWSANLPEEIPWYIDRLTGTWAPISVLVLLGHFALPFALLLSRSWKRQARALSRIALWVLLMRVVDLVWTIGPVFREHHTLSWLDFAVVAGMGGVWLVLFAMNLGARALVPAHDPYFKDALAHGAH